MNLHILPVSELAKAAANYVSQLSALAIAARGRFTVALSGGSLIQLLCPQLTTEPLRSQINWKVWHAFCVDERCVPKTNPESNYYQARKYLFDHVNIPQAQIYVPDTSIAPHESAVAYQMTLQRVFRPPPGPFPVFDLILLGMGEDGHTASLFPHHSILKESNHWVAPVFDSPKPPPRRITMTLPVINNAHQVVFLVAGKEKADVVRQVLGTKAVPGDLPVQMVQPAHGELHWFVDDTAAFRLVKIKPQIDKNSII